MSGPGFSDFLESCGRPVAYFPSLAKVLGSIKAAVFLAQLMYWTPRGKKADGWVFKTAEEWEADTGLTYEEQLGAKKILGEDGKNVIEIRYSRNEHTSYYRVKRGVLDALWEASRENLDAQEHQGKASVASGKSLGGTKGKPSSVFQRLPRDYPETTKQPAPDGAGEPVQAAQGGILFEDAVGVEAVLEASPVPRQRPAVGTHVVAAPAAALGAHDPTPPGSANPLHPAAAAPARRGHPAIATYYDRWRAHHGKTPTISPKRVGILNRIYKGLGPEASEEYPRLLDALFSSPDNFIITNAHSPEVFETRLDALRVNGNGHAGRGAAAPEAPSGRQSKRINDKFVGAETGRVLL